MASADKRILYTEYMVGATHPSLADTLNRLALIDHANSGAHTAITRADLTNKDGSTLSTVGTVVIQDTGNASAFKRTTSANSTLPVYIVQESIANNDTGRVAYGGYSTVLVQGNVAIGDYLGTSATTGRAASQGATALAGAFAIAETAYSGGAAGTVTARLVPTIASSAAALPSVVRGVVGATASTTTYTYTGADFIAFYNPTSKTIEKIVTAQGSLTNTITSASARNGRDQAGAFSVSSWVYLYYTWDGTTVATRSSATAPPTGPTLANGETSWAFIGAYFLDGSTLFTNTYTRGNWIDYQARQVALNAGTQTAFTSVALTSLVPPQAAAPNVRMGSLLHTDITGAPTNFSVTATLSLDNSSTYTLQSHTGQVSAGTGPIEAAPPSETFPNISQTLYYKVAVTGGGTTPSLSLWVLGYAVANGG